MKRIPRAALLYLVIGAAVLFVGIRFSSRSPEREAIDLSEFRQAIEDGEVATAEIKDQDHQVTGKLVDDTEYKVAYPAEFADELVDELHDADPPVEVTTIRSPTRCGPACCSACCRSCCWSAPSC